MSDMIFETWELSGPLAECKSYVRLNRGRWLVIRQEWNWFSVYRLSYSPPTRG